MDGKPEFLSNRLMGFTLMETALALFILAFLLLALTASFSATGIWFSRARDQDRATAYAASIVNVLRTYSIELKDEMGGEGVLHISDPNPADEVMEFILDGTAIHLNAPPGYRAEIEACYFEDGGYYQGDSAEGTQYIGEGENAVPVFFKENLMEVDIEIQWDGEDYRLSTVIGAR